MDFEDEMKEMKGGRGAGGYGDGLKKVKLTRRIARRCVCVQPCNDDDEDDDADDEGEEVEKYHQSETA